MFIKLFKNVKTGMKGHRDYTENLVPILIKISSITAMTDYKVYFDGNVIDVEESMEEIQLQYTKAEILVYGG